ncbi:MAG: transcriptional repressor LexA [Anaerolinea sp.]|nr:transcriptional repressor LexA [Anaerolinea sp.]CAG1014569.1 repressor LexA [Anaerolineae bacterium]
MNYEALSEKQKSILRVIEEWVNQRGYPPTIRDIGREVGISSTSVVNYNLNKLVDAGFITRSKKFSRGIRVTGHNDGEMRPIIATDSESLQVRHLGQIVAGMPVPTLDGYAGDEAIPVPSMLIGSHDPAQVYALTVKGHSMIDAMIDDGDMVILKHQQTARNGDMVAAWLIEREETTLKYFFEEGGRIRLQPANPTMDPIFVEKGKIQIQGKVLAVIRRVN